MSGIGFITSLALLMLICHGESYADNTLRRNIIHPFHLTDSMQTADTVIKEAIYVHGDDTIKMSLPGNLPDSAIESKRQITRAGKPVQFELIGIDKHVSITSPHDAGEALDKQSKYISTIVLIFGIVLIVLILFMGRTGAIDVNAMRLIGVIVILTGALFMMAAGWDEKQITPVKELLGTLAGYLLGAASTVTGNKKSKKTRKSSGTSTGSDTVDLG